MISVFLMSIMIILLSTHKINKLQDKVADLEQKSENYYEALSYLTDRDSLPEKNTHLHASWKESAKVAKKISKETDGQFKYEWSLFLVNEAKKYNIDPFLVYELLKVETGGKFDPSLEGPNTKYGKAYGLAQFMKNTAPWVAEMGGLPYKDELLYDPYYSIQLSVVYLDFLSNRYNGDWDKALTAYHRGMGGLKNFIKVNGHAKSWYAKEILSNAKEHQMIAYNN